MRAGWRRPDGHGAAAAASGGRTGICGPVFAGLASEFIADADTVADADTDTDSHAHAHSDTHADTDEDSHADTDADAHA